MSGPLRRSAGLQTGITGSEGVERPHRRTAEHWRPRGSGTRRQRRAWCPSPWRSARRSGLSPVNREAGKLTYTSRCAGSVRRASSGNCVARTPASSSGTGWHHSSGPSPSTQRCYERPRLNPRFSKREPLCNVRVLSLCSRVVQVWVDVDSVFDGPNFFELPAGSGVPCLNRKSPGPPCEPRRGPLVRFLQWRLAQRSRDMHFRSHKGVLCPECQRREPRRCKSCPTPEPRSWAVPVPPPLYPCGRNTKGAFPCEVTTTQAST